MNEDYSKWSINELTTYLSQYDIEKEDIEGTGKNGRILKSDLIRTVNKITNKSPNKSNKSPNKSNKSNKSPNKLPKTILTYLPDETHEQIMLEMEPSILINACIINKKALQICTNDQFWEKYYKQRNINFKPYQYDYKERITTARMQLMNAMTINELENECKSDKNAKSICKSNDFWKNYFRLHDVMFHELKYHPKITNRFKEFKIGLLVTEIGNKDRYKIYAKITDVYGFEYIYQKHRKFHNPDNNTVSSYLEDKKFIYINVDIWQPDSFRFNLFVDKPKEGIEFGQDYEFLYDLYDIMGDIKIKSRFY